MGEKLLCGEILEHVLQYADGETLLMCRQVAPIFSETVRYLGRKKNIWKKTFFAEKDRYPYDIISKLFPHSEGVNDNNNWGLIYESYLLRNFLNCKTPPLLKAFTIGKAYSNIQEIETHDGNILVLLRYNKDHAKYYKILTLNINNMVIDKSYKFLANMLYLTGIKDKATLRTDVIPLFCKHCQFYAVPVFSDQAVEGYPKFEKEDNFLTVEHADGQFLWINRFGTFLTPKRVFHTGRDVTYGDLLQRDLHTVKVFSGFTSLFISCGHTRLELSTFNDLRAKVTAYYYYCEVLFLGTDSGTLLAYKLKDETELESLDLKNPIRSFDICTHPLTGINVMELKKRFIILCSSNKTLFQVQIKRKLLNFDL